MRSLLLGVGFAAGLGLFLSPLATTFGQAAPFCQPGQAPHFAFGFASLKAALGDVMGDPIECEHASPPSGDVLQQTSTGLAYWRRATNTPTFTDGSSHWALTVDGLVAWDGPAVDPPGSVVVPPSPPAASPTPPPPATPTLSPTATSSPSGGSATQPTPTPAAPSPTPTSTMAAPGAQLPNLVVRSPAFPPGGTLPTTVTCENIPEPSPPLTWAPGPPGTRSFALVMDAPARPGGILSHWLVYNLPPDRPELAENLPKTDRLPNGALQGRNDGGTLGYLAPCPPANTPYTYRFTVFALDTLLSLGPGASAPDLTQAIQGHMLARGELTATYLRPSWPFG